MSNVTHHHSHTEPWDVSRAAAVYRMPGWAGGYFSVNAQGHVVACPQTDGTEIDLYEVAHAVRERGLRWPVLVRIDEILQDRVRQIGKAFDEAMQKENYFGGYTAVYPIKVNQQGSVIEELISAERAIGLEAGSKPELLAVLGMAPPGARIVCNGYKDRAFIRMALIGLHMGHDVTLVIEKPSELADIQQESSALGIQPKLGLRVRLASIAAGKWQNTGGEKAKFGLSAPQVIDLLDSLKKHQLLECLHMLHVHLGSQVAGLRDIQRGMAETARYYVELREQGVPLDTVDVGGGLAVDYEGSGSRNSCSMNYELHEYALAVIRALATVCKTSGQPQPHVISESGRALTAHHAVLITQVIDHEQPVLTEPAAPAFDRAVDEISDLWALFQSPGNPVEAMAEAEHLMDDIHAAYTSGQLGLTQRAWAERTQSALLAKLVPMLNPQQRSHREVLEQLREKLADKYFLNLSIFQSLPDIWALDQIFPIMPLHRLDEKPAHRVTLCDLTCDSDGRIDEYVDEGGLETTLPAHPLREGEDYLIGIFMVGAYQETLGDIHNLFGDTDAINVELTQQGWRLHSEETGDQVRELLAHVHIDPQRLKLCWQEKLANDAAGDAYLSELLQQLDDYTYLHD